MSVRRVAVVECDVCGEVFAGLDDALSRETGKGQRDHFEARGWRYWNQFDLCPECQEGIEARPEKRMSAAFYAYREEVRAGALAGKR